MEIHKTMLPLRWASYVVYNSVNLNEKRFLNKRNTVLEQERGFSRRQKNTVVFMVDNAVYSM